MRVLFFKAAIHATLHLSIIHCAHVPTDMKQFASSKRCPTPAFLRLQNLIPSQLGNSKRTNEKS